MLLKNIWLLAHEVLQELSQHQGCALVLFLLATQLFIDFKAVILHVFIVSLRVSQFLLNLFKFHLEEVDQLLAFEIVGVLFEALLHSLTSLLLLNHAVLLSL